MQDLHKIHTHKIPLGDDFNKHQILTENGVNLFEKVLRYLSVWCLSRSERKKGPSLVGIAGEGNVVR